jgi:hypothetical protein
METNLKSFRSDRRFSVFSYGISHGPLLLRSGKTNEHPTRIDVLILDVRAMEIRSWFEGFEITKVDQDYLRNFRSNPIEMMQPGLGVYALSGKDWQGFILGGNLSAQQDEADFMASSALMREGLLERPLGFARENEISEATRPTGSEIEAAIRVLYEEGRFHHWWPTNTKPYDEFAATDPIGMSEFGGIAERILMAASRARLNVEMP